MDNPKGKISSDQDCLIEWNNYVSKRDSRKVTGQKYSKSVMKYI